MLKTILKKVKLKVTTIIWILNINYPCYLLSCLCLRILCLNLISINPFYVKTNIIFLKFLYFIRLDYKGAFILNHKILRFIILKLSFKNLKLFNFTINNTLNCLKKRI